MAWGPLNRDSGRRSRLLPFSAFWLRSSVVSVLISVITDILSTALEYLSLAFLGPGSARVASQLKPARLCERLPTDVHGLAPTPCDVNHTCKTFFLDFFSELSPLGPGPPGLGAPHEDATRWRRPPTNSPPVCASRRGGVRRRTSKRCGPAGQRVRWTVVRSFVTE